MNTDDTHFSDNIWERAYRELGYANSDFTDKHTGATDFMCDVNGNMVRDENKGMSLAYNHLDRITRVSFDSGAEIQYLYNGSGVKLRKKAIASDGTVNTTHYVGAFRYNDDGLSFISSSEGRLMPDDANDIFQFEYHLKDHLGSMRLAFSDLNDDHIIDNNTEILQVESYYPFGMKHEGIQTPQVGPKNLYNYTGKEDQTDFGFAMIDYGARMMDATLGRWHCIDPLATDYVSWSSYNYVLGNPISLVDPDGRCAANPSTDVVENEDGSYTVVGACDDGDNNVYVQDSEGNRTDEVIAQTVNPWDFLNTSNVTGEFTEPVRVTFSLFDLQSGEQLGSKYLEAFKNGIGDMAHSDIALIYLAILSPTNGPLDIKSLEGQTDFDRYSVVSFDGKITSLRTLGNLLFGANMRSIYDNFENKEGLSKDKFYKYAMDWVGGYNQVSNSGQGYNRGWPFYGEHTYSGSSIYHGFNHKPLPEVVSERFREMRIK